ncbi:MAG TPA: hypothetical protein VMG10_35785 [Gemmataceae bacterium]|nr:hypothetical protein [Gemmataceae bacterium]
MQRHTGIGVILLVLLADGWACAGAPPCCEPSVTGFFQRLTPAGGWCPYGGGLLHWWSPHCFPRCGGPDDYCRKKLPRLCWPPYPSYYIWGPPENSFPQGACRRASNETPY